MRFILFSFLFFLSFVHVQAQYWQQAVDYTMDVELDPESANYFGSQTLVYTNNSPETLHKVFYHLYFNAFRPGSEMAVRLKSAPDQNRRFKVDLDSLTAEQQGFLKVIDLKQDGELVKVVNSETILEVILNKPIPPGGTSTFELQFNGHVPDVIRRAGKSPAKESLFQWHNGILKWLNTMWRVGIPIPIQEENFMVFGAILMLKLL